MAKKVYYGDMRLATMEDVQNYVASVIATLNLAPLDYITAGTDGLTRMDLSTGQFSMMLGGPNGSGVFDITSGVFAVGYAGNRPLQLGGDRVSILSEARMDIVAVDGMRLGVGAYDVTTGLAGLEFGFVEGVAPFKHGTVNLWVNDKSSSTATAMTSLQMKGGVEDTDFALITPRGLDPVFYVSQSEAYLSVSNTDASEGGSFYLGTSNFDIGYREGNISTTYSVNPSIGHVWTTNGKKAMVVGPSTLSPVIDANTSVFGNFAGAGGELPAWINCITGDANGITTMKVAPLFEMQVKQENGTTINAVRVEHTGVFVGDSQSMTFVNGQGIAIVSGSTWPNRRGIVMAQGGGDILTFIDSNHGSEPTGAAWASYLSNNGLAIGQTGQYAFGKAYVSEDIQGAYPSFQNYVLVAGQNAANPVPTTVGVVYGAGSGSAPEWAANIHGDATGINWIRTADKFVLGNIDNSQNRRRLFMLDGSTDDAGVYMYTDGGGLLGPTEGHTFNIVPTVYDGRSLTGQYAFMTAEVQLDKTVSDVSAVFSLSTGQYAMCAAFGYQGNSDFPSIVGGLQANLISGGGSSAGTPFIESDSYGITTLRLSKNGFRMGMVDPNYPSNGTVIPVIEMTDSMGISTMLVASPQFSMRMNLGGTNYGTYADVLTAVARSNYDANIALGGSAVSGVAILSDGDLRLKGTGSWRQDTGSPYDAAAYIANNNLSNGSLTELVSNTTINVLAKSGDINLTATAGKINLSPANGVYSTSDVHVQS